MKENVSGCFIFWTQCSINGLLMKLGGIGVDFSQTKVIPVHWYPGSQTPTYSALGWRMTYVLPVGAVVYFLLVFDLLTKQKAELWRCWCVQMKEERLRRLFDEYGQITECSLKYTKDGVFRKFAFIGFHSESGANAAVSHRNNTYVDTSKIQVWLVVSVLASTNSLMWHIVTSIKWSCTVNNFFSCQ